MTEVLAFIIGVLVGGGGTVVGLITVGLRTGVLVSPPEPPSPAITNIAPGIATLTNPPRSHTGFPVAV